jgi:SAM-dependent methyltransferase
MMTLDLLQKLEERMCPVCGSGPDKAISFLKQSVDPAKLDAFSYASRKTPEYMSFNLVTCRDCQTVYASPAPPSQAVSQAYHEADYDSSDEAVLAASTYGDALARDLAGLADKGDALEIGTGTGVFLSVLQAAGFARVTGVEPSPKAIAAADPAIRPHIREGIFVEADFAPESFDLICCFMTLEHVPDPRPLVEACSRLLRAGGLLALVTHDYKAPVNRILGRRSPIIDVEHLQIFCPESLERLVSGSKLDIVRIESFANRYALRYWLRLMPLPRGLKAQLGRLFSATGVERQLISLRVGNLLTVARKPR